MSPSGRAACISSLIVTRMTEQESLADTHYRNAWRCARSPFRLLSGSQSSHPLGPSREMGNSTVVSDSIPRRRRGSRNWIVGHCQDVRTLSGNGFLCRHGGHSSFAQSMPGCLQLIRETLRRFGSNRLGKIMDSCLADPADSCRDASCPHRYSRPTRRILLEA